MLDSFPKLGEAGLCLGFRVQGFGFRVLGLGFGMCGAEDALETAAIKSLQVGPEHSLEFALNQKALEAISESETEVGKRFQADDLGEQGPLRNTVRV